MTETKRAWCAILAKLVAPMEPERATKAFVAMLPMLPQDERLYTAESARAVASGDRKTAVPTFGDIERAFGAMWKDSLPVEVRMGGAVTAGRAIERIPAPKAPTKTPEEIAAVEAKRAAITAELRAMADARRPNGARPKPSHATPQQLVAHYAKTEAGRRTIAMRPDLAAVWAQMRAEGGEGGKSDTDYPQERKAAGDPSYAVYAGVDYGKSAP